MQTVSVSGLPGKRIGTAVRVGLAAVAAVSFLVLPIVLLGGAEASEPLSSLLLVSVVLLFGLGMMATVAAITGRVRIRWIGVAIAAAVVGLVGPMLLIRRRLPPEFKREESNRDGD